jgi:hypothetical protein
MKSFIFTILTFFCLPYSLYCQNATYSLSIIVKDQLHNRIINAQIALNKSDKEIKTISTNKQGVGFFEKLAPGEYSFTVKAKGFKEYLSEKISLDTVFTRTIEINLEIAPIEESVEIDPSKIANSENYGFRKVLTEEELRLLPDDPEEFERAVRQIMGQSITGEELGITVNGLPKSTLPPKEAIQQIRVDQNIFSAKNSRVGGSGIEVITKAGMTKFEGSVIFSLSDSRFDAKNSFLGIEVPYSNRGYRLNLTGPLTKKSSFIMMLDRGERYSSAAINATTLSDDLRIVNIKQIFAIPRTNHGLDLYLNYDPKDKHKLFFNYVYNINQGKGGVGGFSLPDSLTNSTNQTHSFSISHQYLGAANFTTKSIVSINYSTRKASASNSNPVITVLDAFTSGSYLNRRSTNTNQIKLSNDTEYQHKKHNFQLGFQINFDKRRIYSTENFNGTFLFTGKTAPSLDENNAPLLDSDGNLIMERISSIESYRRNLLFRRNGLSPTQIRQLGGSPDQFTLSSGNPELSVSQIDLAAYIQDNIQLNETTGIGIGLRYEKQTNTKSKLNFSPRMSLIWSPQNNKRKPIFTLPKISLGGGLYFSSFDIETKINEQLLNNTDRVSYFINNSSVLDVFPDIPSLGLLETTSNARNNTFISPNIRNSFQTTFNASISKNITKQFGVNFSFTRANNFRNLITRNVNAPVPNTNNYPLGEIGYVYKIDAVGKSVVDTISISPKLPSPKFGKYVGFLNFGYSFIKGRSNTINGSGSPFDPYDFSNEYSPTLLDGVHNFSMSYFQNLPFDTRINLIGSIRSGSRFNIITGEDTNRDGYYFERPAFASNPNKFGVISTIYGLLDPNPSIGDEIIPRNLGRGPTVYDFNFSLNKSFGFNRDPKTKKAKQSLNINVSVTNIFNITNRGIPIGNMSSPNFLNYLNTSAEFFSNPRRFNFNIGFKF